MPNYGTYFDPKFAPQSGYYPQSYSVPYQPISPQQQPSASQIRQVYSEAEARAAQIPTDGNPVFFIEQGGEVIYAKRFSYETGAFPFEVYKRVNQQNTAAPRYATIEDLERLRMELMHKEDMSNAE